MDETVFQDSPCACADSAFGDPCVCSQNERALRNYCNGAKMPPMTEKQREYCLSEIASVEGFDRTKHHGDDDWHLASTTLTAWRDYCRDKGFAV